MRSNVQGFEPTRETRALPKQLRSLPAHVSSALSAGALGASTL